MKTIRILALAAALAAVPAFASDFGHEQALTIDGKPAHLAETSARILANETLTAPQLVEDITDGFGSKKIPGYKLMIMGRTYSVAAETKPPKESQTQWRDNTFIHRGVKLFVGIPVKNGKMDLASARLINIGVVDDNGGAAPHDEGEKIRPVGKQLMSPDTKVENVKLNIAKLTLPNMKLGETSGGGVKLEASATLDGKPIQTKIDSTFSRFYSAKPAATRPFMADVRFVK